MTWKHKKGLPKAELAILLGLAMLLAWGTAMERQQQRIAGSMIRLHVVANSDSEQDQAVKLEVRDAVLAEASGFLRDCESPLEAREALSAHRDALTLAANEALAAEGFSETARVTLQRELFTTRDYGGFSLPGGYYDALRVTIGQGAGHNWWCVVYPQLCAAATVSDRRAVAVSGGLDPELLQILERDTPEYELKFRSLELLEDFLGWFRSREGNNSTR